MSLDIKIDGSTSSVKLLSREANLIKISVDNKIYDIDFQKVGNGIYSLLYKNHSYNVELVRGRTGREYYVNTPHESFELEIIDAQARYEQARLKNEGLEGVNVITSPMPGKVMRILVAEGDQVEQGQPVIVISAMKMESEYKAGVAGIVKKIHVASGDTVDSHQVLLVIE